MNGTTSVRSGMARWMASGLAAVVLVIATTGSTLAVSWGAEVRLSGTYTNRPEILRTGGSSAIVVWQAGASVYARRTSTAGETWSATTTLATGIGLYPSASAYGSRVDLAYVKRIRNADGSIADRLFYRRSTNGGASWESPRAVTSSTSQVGDQDVTRHPDGTVTIVWNGLYTGRIYARMSRDGGTSFGPARYVGRTYNWEPGRRITYRADPVVAIGDRVTYVAYTSARDTVAVTRSRDAGLTWSTPVKFDSSASGFYSIAAAGAKAVVGYTTTSSGSARAVYRRTADRGATWSRTKWVVAQGSTQFSMEPQFAYHRGLLVVSFKYGQPGGSPVWHRPSPDFGLSWSTLSRVSVAHGSQPEPEPGGVAILDRRHLAAYNANGEPGNIGLWVRRTQP